MYAYCKNFFSNENITPLDNQYTTANGSKSGKFRNLQSIAMSILQPVEFFKHKQMQTPGHTYETYRVCDNPSQFELNSLFVSNLVF